MTTADNVINQTLLAAAELIVDIFEGRLTGEADTYRTWRARRTHKVGN